VDIAHSGYWFDLFSGAFGILSSGALSWRIIVYNRLSQLIALFLLAVCALLLHTRIHPIMLTPEGAAQATLNIPNLIAFLFCLVDVVLITLFFCFSTTSIYGYLLNGMLAIYATILMGHFSLHVWLTKSTTFGGWLFSSTLPDIGIAWADFFIGRSLFFTYQNADK
jgi:hypothetical protein